MASELVPLPLTVVTIPANTTDIADTGPVPFVHAAEALALLLADSRSPETRRAYQRDLNDFFRVQGRDPGADAVQWLCSQDAGGLALLLNAYKGNQRNRGLSEATVNRRLAALRALLRFCRRLGANVPDPAGLVTSEKQHAYRDTRGTELAQTRALLAAPDRSTVKGKRDYALLLLLAENALRRGEVTGLSVVHFEPGGFRLSIRGKGRGTQREPVTLSPAAVTALSDYLHARQQGGERMGADTALFLSHSKGNRAEGDRLTGHGLWRVVRYYGAKTLNVPLAPHKLRHAAITAALDATGGNVRTVQRLSRHADIRTLQRYDDNRSDLQGETTRLLSGLLHDPQALKKGRQG